MRDAAFQLADLLAERGDLDEAAQVLRARADAGHMDAALRLVDLLAGRGDLGRATQIVDDLEQLQIGLADVRASSCSRPGHGLAGLLAGRGDLAGATQLRARVSISDKDAALRLDVLLAKRGDLDGAARPRRRRRCGRRLGGWPGLLEERGDLDGAARPRRRSATSTPPSGWPGLLEERGDLDGLRARADARRPARRRAAGQGCWKSAATWTGCAPGPTPATGTPLSRLAGLLTKQGRREEAERLRRFGLEPDGSIASTWQAFRIKVRLRHVAGPGCGSNALPRQSRSGGCHPGRSPPAPPAPAVAQ